jgi:predicted Fe-Mo cluster-binding NifX family protein
MKIAITSQNFRTITGHAGKTRRFLVFSYDAQGNLIKENPIDLPKEMSMHEFKGAEHPLDEIDYLITTSCGDGFMRKMNSRGVKVIQTSESDPLVAVGKLIAGKPLLAAAPHEHETHSNTVEVTTNLATICHSQENL